MGCRTRAKNDYKAIVGKAPTESDLYRGIVDNFGDKDLICRRQAKQAADRHAALAGCVAHGKETLGEFGLDSNDYNVVAQAAPALAIVGTQVTLICLLSNTHFCE